MIFKKKHMNHWGLGQLEDRNESLEKEPFPETFPTTGSMLYFLI